MRYIYGPRCRRDGQGGSKRNRDSGCVTVHFCHFTPAAAIPARKDQNIMRSSFDKDYTTQLIECLLRLDVIRLSMRYVDVTEDEIRKHIRARDLIEFLNEKGVQLWPFRQWEDALRGLNLETSRYSGGNYGVLLLIEGTCRLLAREINSDGGTHISRHDLLNERAEVLAACTSLRKAAEKKDWSSHVETLLTEIVEEVSEGTN